MTPTIKAGSTLRIRLQCDETEWAAIWPWDAARAQARQGGQAFDLAVSANPDLREIWISGDTTGWPARLYAIDLRLTHGPQHTYVPPVGTLAVRITTAATKG